MRKKKTHTHISAGTHGAAHTRCVCAWCREAKKLTNMHWNVSMPGLHTHRKYKRMIVCTMY
jgi:hypothetical protein